MQLPTIRLFYRRFVISSRVIGHIVGCDGRASGLEILSDNDIAFSPSGSVRRCNLADLIRIILIYIMHYTKKHRIFKAQLTITWRWLD